MSFLKVENLTHVYGSGVKGSKAAIKNISFSINRGDVLGIIGHTGSGKSTLVTHLNDEKNDELLLVNELRFDLDPLITEDIFLDLPAKFLCKEDCKGMCYKCGKDLNTDSCSCKKDVDPRLAALQQLLDN